jgi:hypothetical protein
MSLTKGEKLVKETVELFRAVPDDGKRSVATKEETEGLRCNKVVGLIFFQEVSAATD